MLPVLQVLLSIRWTKRTVRVYLPSSFVASIHLIQMVEREYAGDYEPYRKCVIRLTIGDTLYALFVGANSLG